MRLRRNVWPRTAADIGCFLLIFTFIPITFVFEMTVVLPEFHEVGGLLNVLTWILGFFLLFNIIGNMLACMLVDTSIKAVLLTPPTNAALRQYWHMCEECEVLAPPRSWHCSTCKTCILKRDHHCLFTGCCVGHCNQRYFLLFMLYVAIGSAYTTVYNSLYFWRLHADTYANLGTALRMVFPMFILTVDLSWANFYILIYELNIIALGQSVVLLCYHLPILLKGSVVHERHTAKYDLGWQRNLEMVLGKRMHLTWLSPFLESELPHDGVHWETLIDQSLKNR